MARGITQIDVDRAADALLQAGERPTIERVRQFLGTGSPNTITRLLEGWWQALGTRLELQAQQMALPDAPKPVQALAAQLWNAALEAGTAHAEGALARAHEDAAAAVRHARAASAAAQAAADAARTDSDAARAERDQAQTRIADLQRLADLQARQLTEARALAERAQQALAATQADAATLRGQLDAVRQEAAASQAEHTAHLRQLEDRAHTEIDVARQQLRELRTESVRVQEQWRQTEDALRHGLETARAAAATAEREAAAQRARADALAQQVATLGDLPAVVRASLAETAKAPRRRQAAARSVNTPTPKKPRTGRGERGAGDRT